MSVKIGDNFGGGVVFYVDASGEHGLIAAKEDLPGGFIYTWEFAVDACGKLKLEGYSDWRLPDKEEIDKLWLARIIVGGFSLEGETAYWSSEESGQLAWGKSFWRARSNVGGLKKALMRVRPIRTF